MHCLSGRAERSRHLAGMQVRSFLEKEHHLHLGVGETVTLGGVVEAVPKASVEVSLSGDQLAGVGADLLRTWARSR